MRITRLELDNCGPFEHVEIDLDRPFTLLAGENGAGKSTVLRALGAVLGGDDAAALGKVSRSDVDGEIVATTGQAEIRATARIGLTEQTLAVAVPPRDSWATQRPPPLWAQIDMSGGMRRLRRSGGWAVIDDSWRELSAWFSEHKQGALEKGYDDARRKLPVKTLLEYDPLLATVGTAVSAAIGERVEFDFSFRQRQFHVRLGDESILLQSELSAGYRMVLTAVANLALEALVQNPTFGADAPLLVEGVVLIDELDAHLHPRWQRTIVSGLQRAFPKVQFICATHSPQILAEAPKGSVVVLDGTSRVQYPAYTFGRDSNAILHELMGVDPRPSALAVRFDAFDAAVDAGDLARARELLRELEADLGEVPEIVRAATTLRLEEGAAAEEES